MTGSEAPAGIRQTAPAKVNLYLHVVGRRADGYHAIDSLVAFAGIGDGLTAGAADELTLAVEGPFAGALPAPGDNLVLAAARRLAAAAGVAPRAALRLVKRLPVAAGIGGGSADAAAALRALARLWGVATVDLAGLAASLGADVPVCLAARASLVAGIGERLRPAPALPVVSAVLVNPGVALATAAVFAAREGAFSTPAPPIEAPADAAALAQALATRSNDLEAPARRLAPVIDAVLAALAAQPGCLIARMSGSGATCFALFAGPGAAATAAERIAAARPDWWVVATRFGGAAPA